MSSRKAFTRSDLIAAVDSNPQAICDLINTLRCENEELNRKVNGEVKGDKRKLDVDAGLGLDYAPPRKRARTTVEREKLDLYEALRQENIVKGGLGVLDPSFWEGYGPRSLDKGTQTPVAWKQMLFKENVAMRLPDRAKPHVQPSSASPGVRVAGTPSKLRVKTRSMYAREEAEAGKDVTNQDITNMSPALGPKWAKAFGAHEMTDDELRWLCRVRIWREKKHWPDLSEWVRLLLGRYRNCVRRQVDETVKDFEKRIKDRSNFNRQNVSG